MSLLERILIPKENANDDSAIITSLNKVDQSFVKKDEVILEVTTSKITLELTSNYDGYLKLNCELKQKYDFGYCVAEIYSNKDDTLNTSKEENKSEKNEKSKVVITKPATKLIEENSLDINLFKGLEFISEKNVLDFLKDEKSKSNNNITKLDGAKLNEIDYLENTYNTVIPSTLFNTVHFDKQITKNNLLKNSILPYIIQESYFLLKSYPKLNAYFNDNQIYFYPEIKIGVALDLDKGLRVLQLNDDYKNLDNIQKNILLLIDKYLDNKIKKEDTMTTFTITDLSNYSIDFFVPVINYKQSCVLGIGKFNETNNSFIISCTYDHKVTEGKYVSNFLDELKENIENKYSPQDGNNLIECKSCLKKLDDFEIKNNFGFITVKDNHGESYLCRNCFEGY